MKKEELIDILENKGKKTYKELAIMVGYHEKSLIRINRQLKEGTYSIMHKNCFRIPHNKIKEEVKERLIKEFLNSSFKTKKDFYNYLKTKNINYSYTYLCRILPKKRSENKLKVKKERNNIVKRKMINDNLLQYNNKRYKVLSEYIIKHHEIVNLVIDKNNRPLYIKYKNNNYDLLFLKDVYSRKGNSKYF